MTFDRTIRIFLFVFTLVTIFAKNTFANRRKFVIDTEPGLDDAVALVTAFGQPDVKILGLTVPSGNSDTEQASKNAVRILAAADKKIPIFKGSTLPLLGKYQFNGSDNFFGKDGLGDADSAGETLDPRLIRSKHAAVALVDFVKENPGEVSIVALGPLTNIALAIRLDPTFATKTKELHIMGGSPTATGNKGAVAEFNFELDPEAALVVFQEMQCPIYVATWDLCLENLLTIAQKEDLFSGKSKLGKFLRKIHYSNETIRNQSTYTLCDSISMAYALNRTVASETPAMYTTVELCGKHTRGQMIVDSKGVYHLKPNANLLKDVNLDKLLWMIKKGIMSN